MKIRLLLSGIAAGACFHAAMAQQMSLAQTQKTAEQGNAASENNLGLAYVHGQGVPRDYAKAVFWFRKAAYQRLAQAEYNLGDENFLGHGTPRNFERAYFWLDLAAAQGFANAAAQRDRIENLLTPAELAEAQRRASTWTPQVKQ